VTDCNNSHEEPRGSSSFFKPSLGFPIYTLSTVPRFKLSAADPWLLMAVVAICHAFMSKETR